VVGREREPELLIGKPLPLPALTGRAPAGGNLVSDHGPRCSGIESASPARVPFVPKTNIKYFRQHAINKLLLYNLFILCHIPAYA
jgi:hypothetical protein